MSSDLHPLPPGRLLALLATKSTRPPRPATTRVRAYGTACTQSVGNWRTTADLSLAVLRSSGKLTAAGKSSLLAGVVRSSSRSALTLGGARRDGVCRVARAGLGRPSP